jgi:phospholipid/cholesterol/gamma-HCH transport system substrate-binding protein
MAAGAGRPERPMITKSSYVLVGIFILVLSAAFVWGVLWISAGGATGNFDRYLVYMPESVSGLNVDAALKYRGVEVGKVEQISIEPEKPEVIRLLLQVQQGTPISEDTVATLEYQGLTGIATINLSGGHRNSKPLERAPGEDYPVIAARPSFFATLDTTLADLLTSLTDTTAGINALLNDQNQANVARSLENIAVLSERFAEQSGKLESILTDLGVTLENTREASADFPALVDQFSRSAQAITGMAEQFRTIGENLAAASTRVEQALEVSGGDLTGFTGTALPEIAEMVSELRVASEHLRRLSEDLAQDPSLLLYGKPEPEPGPGE